MMPYYNVEEAAKRLEAISNDRYDSPHSGIQLSRVLSVASEYEVVNVGNIWKLVQTAGTSDASDTYEEVNAIFQGVITKHDLPPFTEKIKNTQAKYLRQSVTVSGLGNLAFNKIVNVVSEVHSVFARTIGPSRVEDCMAIGTHPETQMFEIEIANRYFDYRSKSTAPEILFTKDIDPHGYLAQAVSPGMFHSEDNVVAYFARRGKTDEDYQYEAVKPIVFSPGDIVEVHASFAAVPLKDDRFKMIIVLRGLTLIDDSFTKSARALRMTQLNTGHVAKAPVILKRKAAYDAELVSVTRAKLDRMHISSNNQQKSTSKASVGEASSNENDDLERVEAELMVEKEVHSKRSY